MKTELTDIFTQVKSDFCNLIDYKMRDLTLEITTGVSTLTNRYVSVFVSVQGEKYVVSDGGWIDRQYYDNKITPEDEIIFEKVESQYSSYFDIKKVLHKDGTKYCFKATNNFDMISLLVHDVSQYVSSIVNSQAIAYNEIKEKSQTESFYQDVNGYLKSSYRGIIEINKSLQNYNEELSAVKFNAIISLPSTTHLVMYVTGYNTQNFIKDTSEAVVNFQIAARYTQTKKFKKTAIINTAANGFDQFKTRDYLQKLEEEIDNPLVLYYRDKQEIERQIPTRKIA